MERISSSGSSKTVKMGLDRLIIGKGTDERARTEAGLGCRRSIDGRMRFTNEVIREPCRKR